MLNIDILRESASKSLVDALNSVNGAKTLVLDPSLAGPLSLVTEVSLLKHHAVDKMFWLEPGPLTAITTNIVYLCRPSIKNVKLIADQIKRHTKESIQHTYKLLFVPRVSTLVSRVLEEEGVLGDVSLSSYNLQFIPIAEDIVSLERDATVKELWVDGDETIIYDSAQALITLQQLFGLFPQIVGKGDHAARLASLITTYLPQTSDSSTPEALLTPSDQVDSLIILDRRVDLITPLLTQLTYEGLIDELFGIKNSHVEVPASLLAAPSDSSSSAVPSTTISPPITSLRKESKKKHHLVHTDELFVDIRDANFSHIGRKLNTVARRLEESYKTSLQAKTIPQLRDVVGKLGTFKTEQQSLRIHTGLSEMIVPLLNTDIFNKSLEIQQNLLASYNISEQITAIEDLIAQGADVQTVVRLACLASITAGGIKQKTLDNLKREILQAYGYGYLPLLIALSNPSLSFLVPSPSLVKYPFAPLRKSLRLLIDDNPESLEEVENDISFTYSGYAPISIRLVQCVAQKGGVLSNPVEKEKDAGDGTGNAKVQAHPIIGWKGFEDVLATIPGETVDIAQKGLGANIPASTIPAVVRDKVSTTVVFFLGGCTYTEIAALRWVGRQNKGRNFLIATTGIISGNSIIDSIADIPKTSTK